MENKDLIEQSEILQDARDKKNWDDGPWRTEPDQVNFTYREYDCQIRRVIGGGHLCGYAAIPKDHFLAKLDRYDDADEYIKVHGGVTYGEFASFTKEGPESYIIGFDCAHVGPGGDLCPGYEAVHREMKKIIKNYPSVFEKTRYKCTYKTIDFVRKEIESMVDQIIDLKEDDGK